MKQQIEEQQLDRLATSPDIPDETIVGLEEAVSYMSHGGYASGPRSKLPRLSGRVLEEIPVLSTTLVTWLGIFKRTRETKLSEGTLIDTYVSPIVKAAVGEMRTKKISTKVNDGECPTQKSLNWRPEKPEIVACQDRKDYPVLHCEVKRGKKDMAKVHWDLQRLARFGRATIIRGFPYACLIQVVRDEFKYMRMTYENGLFILRTVGTINIPFKLDDIDSFVARAGVLRQIRTDVRNQPNPPGPQLNSFTDIKLVLGRLGCTSS